MSHIKQLIQWMGKYRSSRLWRKLKKSHPVLNALCADAWRAGWNLERWDADLADSFFARVPVELSEHGAIILDKIRSAFFDGAVEKAMELQDVRVAQQSGSRTADFNDDADRTTA